MKGDYLWRVIMRKLFIFISSPPHKPRTASSVDAHQNPPGNQASNGGQIPGVNWYKCARCESFQLCAAARNLPANPFFGIARRETILGI